MPQNECFDDFSRPKLRKANSRKMTSDRRSRFDFCVDSNVSSPLSSEAIQQSFISQTEERVPLEPHFPRQAVKPVKPFYQQNMTLPVSADKTQLTGKFTGICCGFDSLPSGLGNWHHESDPSEKNRRKIFYRGEWRLGVWHGVGDLEERISKGSELDVKIVVKSGQFADGMLKFAEDCRVSVCRKLDPQSSVNIHFGGHVVVAEGTIQRFPHFILSAFLNKMAFTSEGNSETLFQKLGQVAVFGTGGLVRDEGYSAVGYWDGLTQKLTECHVNEICTSLEKNVQILKDHLELEYLVSIGANRCKVLEFLVRIIFASSSLKQLCQRLLSEDLREPVSKSVRDIATRILTEFRLKEIVDKFMPFELSSDYMTGILTMVREKIKEYGKTLLSNLIKTEIDAAIDSFNRYSEVDILVVNPNMLTTISSLHEMIRSKCQLAILNLPSTRPGNTNISVEDEKSFENIGTAILLQCRKYYLSQSRSVDMAVIGWAKQKREFSVKLLETRENLKQVTSSCEDYLKHVEALYRLGEKLRNDRNRNKNNEFLRSFFGSLKELLIKFSNQFHDSQQEGNIIVFKTRVEELYIELIRQMQFQLRLSSGFTGPHADKYLPGFAKDLNGVTFFNSLEAAVAGVESVSSDSKGITYEPSSNRYSLRASSDLCPSPSKEVSYVARLNDAADLLEFLDSNLASFANSLDFVIGVTDYVSEIVSSRCREHEWIIRPIIVLQVKFFRRVSTSDLQKRIPLIVAKFLMYLESFMDLHDHFETFGFGKSEERIDSVQDNPKKVMDLAAVLRSKLKSILQAVLTNQINSAETLVEALESQISILQNIQAINYFFQLQGEASQELSSLSTRSQTNNRSVYQLNDLRKLKRAVVDLKVSTPFYGLLLISHGLKILHHKLSGNDDFSRCLLVDKFLRFLVKLISVLPKQAAHAQLSSFYDSKKSMIERCQIMKPKEMMSYLSVMEKMLHMTANQREIKCADAFREFRELNTGRRTESLEVMFRAYNKCFEEYKRLYVSGLVSVTNIADFIRSYFSTSKTVGTSAMVQNEWFKSERESNPSRGHEQTLTEWFWGATKKAADLPVVLAGIAWVLTANSSLIVCSSRDEGRQGYFKESSPEQLLAPHVIQVLGCLQLMGLDGDLSSKTILTHLANVKNHIAEVLTGQGKSWQIGLLSICFALAGFDITVCCYSDYLSARDRNSVNEQYENAFGPELRRIHFKTLNDMVSEAFEPNGSNADESVGMLIKQIVLDGCYTGSTSATITKLVKKTHVSTKRDVLIIDEVDTVVSNELCNSISRIKNIADENFADFLKRFFDQCKCKIRSSDLEGDMQRFWNSELASKGSKELKRFHTFCEIGFIDFKRVFRDAKAVAEYFVLKKKPTIGERGNRFYDTASDNLLFRLSKDMAKVQYLSDNQWSSNTYLDYLNAFLYLELSRHKLPEQKIVENFEAYGYLPIECGEVYFSAIVSKILQSSIMVGVTGSLQNRSSNGFPFLCSGEQNLLGDGLLKTRTTTHFPSFYGDPRVTFNSSSSEYFKIFSGSRLDYLTRLTEKCRSLYDQRKAVLVFLEREGDIVRMSKLLNSVGKLNVLTMNSIQQHSEQYERADHSEEEWLKLIEKTIGPTYCGNVDGSLGSITLAVSNYGRGTDFKASEMANKQGGLHVIQTWLSVDAKEEAQVRGRTARNGEPGVFMMYLFLEELKELLEVDCTEADNYDSLRNKAKEKQDSQYRDVVTTMEKHRVRSQAVLTWMEQAHRDRSAKLAASDKQNVDTSLVENYKRNILSVNE